ncbi:MAG: GGDEF domain-containing protein [Gammaproteobacteria bacterium]|nr:GGDEF domain-containing protein [Gammaproteobacteria bacterium]
MTEEEIDKIMKKIFKREFANLDKFKSFIENNQIEDIDLDGNFAELLDAYSILLQEAVKITKISDINQKKLFGANEELEKQKKLLYLASIVDPLLGIYNRTYVIQVLANEFAKCKRYNQVFSCILIDIDDFKQANDNYGHQVGDQILIRVANVIKKELREVDSFGRYGGEEFIIVLPSTSAYQSSHVAEKLRQKIEKTDYSDLGQGVRITISQGISDTSLGHPDTEDALLHHVDTALYQAKHTGKNRSVIYDPNPGDQAFKFKT